MPKRSSWASAYSRHSLRTSQPRQTFLASRVEPPFSGKNASGSVWAHRARSAQSPSPSSSVPSMNVPSMNVSSTSGSTSPMMCQVLPLVEDTLIDGTFIDGTDEDGEGDWAERALCAQTDPEAFFPEKGGWTREAKT